MKVKIKPNTNRLRQLVRDHGDIWTIISGPHNMVCFNGQPGFNVDSLDETHNRNIPADIVIEINPKV